MSENHQTHQEFEVALLQRLDDQAINRSPFYEALNFCNSAYLTS
jgi:hypothetical protein